MVKVVFKTNLDLIHADKYGWPEELPEVPRVGDLIRSWYSHSSREYYNREANETRRTFDGYQLELEVCRVILVTENKAQWNRGILDHYEVELHLPKGRWESLRAFFTHYERVTGHKFI